MPPVAVIIPVYNEEELLADNVRRLMTYLDGILPGYEIVIVSNGSTDATVEIGGQLAAMYPVITFSHTDKRGVGRAFRRGMSLTEAEKIITVDIDLTTELDFIPRACAFLDRYDVVIGSKQMGSQERSMIRIAGSFLYTLSLKTLVRLPFGDYSIGAKGYRRNTAAPYLDRSEAGSAYVIDIIYRAWHDGARITEIPVRCRDTRDSRFSIAHEGIYRFSHLVRLWLGKKWKSIHR